MKTTSFDSQSFLKTVTSKPGVYRMYDDTNTVIYVGKAKNLKNRLSSYFRKEVNSAKTKALVAQIVSVEIIVTGSETEALILENNLIKEYQPKYNILLRDDKSYPYILVTEHKHPRVTMHRGPKRHKGEYFGPFPSAGAVWESLRIMQKVFPVRQCEDTFYKARSRPCLQHQLKRCSAPCIKGYVTDDNYNEQVNLVKQFLTGKSQDVIAQIITKMEKASEQLMFEEAAFYRDQISTLQKVTEQQNVSGAIEEIDVLAFSSNKGLASVHVLYIRDQKVLGSKNYSPKVPTNSEPSEIITSFIMQFYLNGVGGQNIPKTIVVPELTENLPELEQAIELERGNKVKLITAQRGEKYKYYQLAQKNADIDLATKLADGRAMSSKYKELSEFLKLPKIERMECFDISHTFGEYPIASCVVFGPEGPVKSEYRRYNVKGVKGGDDYGAMAFALEKRYSKVTDVNKVPDILFIDGGKGQLNKAESFFADWPLEKAPVIVGIAKGEGRKPGLETLFMNGGDVEVHMPKASPALHLIQFIRDESHRFAITGHRAKRGKAKTTSILQDVPGIGAKRRQMLLKNFGGLQGLKSATAEQISKVPGISKQLALEIHAFLHDKD
ncbi:excinuclease ABC subunit UvrC [Psychrosphaera sp. F3M07]|uniref:excinuclease ABC subunit UvrC n=1 Tax=Psychrosphaera sp. F3M07 TaxID=2841560 RepID=UPI001C0A1331|nr:excinuclease ABC subunit UvrC [Psychrosphaera sp. F3M07]MBU2918567.1 excinuclease ABC subunit UvrC [Psychrosphaera sp. F3M07]